jgi:hypothetical protein
LYTDENPKDTVTVKFRTKQDIIDTLSKDSFKSKSHARQSQIINLIHQRLRVALERAKDPEVKDRLRTAFEYIKTRKENSKKKTEEMREGEITERCWKGYTQKGMKTMFGKRYPNCVKAKKKRVNEASLGDHLKKLLNFKGDEKREFQKIVDIITKITKKEYPVEGMVGVAVTNVEKKMWGQNFNNPKSVGLRWDFAVTIRPLFTEYNPNNSDDYGEKVLMFQDEFINNAYGMGFNVSSPIGHEKVKDYRINFNWDKPINVKQIEL